MPFRFTCPICSAVTDVEEQFAGQSGACFSCGGMIVLPTLEQIAAQEALPTDNTNIAGASDADNAAAQPLDKTHQLFERDSKRNSRACLKTIVIMVAIFISGGIIWWLVATVGPSIGLLGDEGAGRSRRNLQRIAQAMNAYHADHGSFPPAYFTDAKGKPNHSWRVMLLPYLGEQDLYDRYSFAEPWNGPNNSQLDFLMPGVYQCTEQKNSAVSTETNYMVVTGYETAFPGATPTSEDDIYDSLADTILVAEIENNGVTWLEPTDLDMLKMSFVVNGKAGSEIGSPRSRGALIVTVDETVHHVRDDTPPAVIESMTTIAGGEPVQAADLGR